MRSILGLVVLTGVIFSGHAQSVTETDARVAFEAWSRKSPHFKRKKTPFVRETYRIKKLEKQSLSAGSLPFYAMELEPEGFVIMNSDMRLAPVIAYSDTGSLNLDDVPGNAFRALLLGTMQNRERQLLKVSVQGALFDPLQSIEEAQNTAAWEQLLDPAALDDPVFYGMGGVTNGPFLTTAWNQNNHYNELCPEDPAASSYYDGHAPLGCVAVVGAQIMNYYEWPYRGIGGHSYTDSWNSMTGFHSVVFSDPYDWDHMQDSYNPWGSEPANAVAAVSELMYEVGVAVEMNYEHGGSASSPYDLNAMMNQAFLYEEGTYLYISSTNPPAIADQIRADMLAGRLAEVSIPGHSIVADGHVDDGVNEYFHINYGWGGSNNGWYLVDDIVGDPAMGCVSGLYPAMIPVNVTEDGHTSDSPDVALQWALADVRTAEVQSVSVLSHALQTGTFTDPCEDFSGFESTSTSEYKDWVVAGGGYSGDCFYKDPGGYSNRDYHLTSLEQFVPTAGAALSFRLKARLSSDLFRVMLSDDDGASWSAVYSLTDYYNSSLAWQLVTADLSAYAGSTVLIRFEYVVGGYYSSGGVWLDSISFTDGSRYDWVALQSFASVTGGTVTNLPSGTNTLALQAYDGSDYGNRSPTFTVVVEASGNDTDGDGLPNSWEQLYYGGTTNGNPNAIAANGVNTVMEAYIAGLDPTDSGSFFNASLTNTTGFVVGWSATSGRVYSVYGTTNLLEGFQPLETNIFWPQSSWTDTVERAGSFYRVDVQVDE